MSLNIVIFLGLILYCSSKQVAQVSIVNTHLDQTPKSHAHTVC